MKRLCLLAAMVLGGCTDALIQPDLAKDVTLDDRLALRGTVCTSPPDIADFPVKVVFLIDVSGSSCITDGPNAQQTVGTLCQQENQRLASLTPPVTRPGRRVALENILQRFALQPNVDAAVVPFESTIRGPVPDRSGGQFFLNVAGNLGALLQAAASLQSTLGKGTDYQGALADAYTRIKLDIEKNGRSQAARTKYVVILLTDGSPYPRCTANDDPAQSYATPNINAVLPEVGPWGIWEDNPPEFCNAGDDSVGIDESPFVSGADRNQDYQIFDAVDRMMSLKDQYNVGDIRVHTILLFNLESVIFCGDPCFTDLFNLTTTHMPAKYSGAPNTARAQYARDVATWTLRQIAEVHGNGTFQEFTTAATIELGSLDYSSLASRFAVKTMLASNVFSFPSPGGQEVDSDGDGLPDSTDSQSGGLGTNRFSLDSDNDGFTDAFETAHKAEGFDPLVPDPRGCVAGKAPCRDTDGDGLSNYAEAYLGTIEGIVDTDSDGLPDGAEVALGLDPLIPNDRIKDTDLDGVPDVLEAIFHTNPLADDREFHADQSYRYELNARPTDDNRMCYDFLVSNIRLLTPDSSSGQHGFNYVTLTFGEAPESNVGRDYGAWKRACAFAQFAPPSQRVPEGPELTINEDDWHPLYPDFIPAPGRSLPTNYRNLCVGTAP